jgi:hypothetical protein
MIMIILLFRQILNDLRNYIHLLIQDEKYIRIV